jgi:hypothetical protein
MKEAMANETTADLTDCDVINRSTPERFRRRFIADLTGRISEQ